MASMALESAKGNRLMNRRSDLAARRELLSNLTMRELRTKYKRSVLGWAWSLANPLASMLIFTVVFRVFLKVSPPIGEPSGLNNFALFLLCGLLPWSFFSNAVNGSIGAVIGNAALVKKVYFPRSILVFASVGAWGVSFLIEMAVLIVGLLVAGNFILPWLIPLVFVVAVLIAFASGLALMLAAMNVHFRDVQHLFGIVMQLWFYATPIVYPLTLVPARAHVLGRSLPLRSLYQLNPMVGFVEAIRDCIYDLRFPAASSMGYLLVVSGATFALGLYVFARLEPRMAEDL